MGTGVSQEDVSSAVDFIGCSTLSMPFNYLGTKVGGGISRSNLWDDIIAKVSSRLSKWKLKTLSIGGRLTLIKSVLSSMPLYHMSIYKVPIGVLNKLESLRRNFFNGVDSNERKISMCGWKKVLASKNKGGLGDSSNSTIIDVFIRVFQSGQMIGCEVLGSFSINNFEVKFLEEENPSEQSRLGILS
ncbi:hypothetical protein Tco_0106536 [Tanacetum coccineum]